MESMRKQMLLSNESCVCGDLQKEWIERNALNPVAEQPIDTITVGCGNFFTLVCC